MREFRERIAQNAHYSAGQYLQNLRWNNRVALCNNFIENLAQLLGDKYELIGSCNNDLSRYLIPAGTREQITYYGKPVNSFRVSDHWSWFSNLKKCSLRNYIQCYSRDMPFRRRGRQDRTPQQSRSAEFRSAYSWQTECTITSTARSITGRAVAGPGWKPTRRMFWLNLDCKKGDG